MHIQNMDLFTIFAFVVAFIMTFAATPIAKKIAFKVGAVDVPKDKRRMHTEPKARLGGIAIFYGFLVSVLCFGNFTSGVYERQQIGIIIGSIIVVVLGAFDDIKPRKAWVKFLIQIVAACIPVLMGVRISVISNPLADIFTGTGTWISQPFVALPTWLSYFVSIFWIVGITNAVNLIDGLDGLAAGVSSIAAVTLLSILMIQHTHTFNLLIMAAALAGACFGFLPYNFNPAKLFMGDSGALFLGFILSSISIQGPFKMYVAFSVPFLILGLPIFDTLFAIIRRIIHHQPIMAPDRGHLHHRLIDRGFSQRTTVIILYALSAILAVSAVVIICTDFSGGLILILSVILFCIFALAFVDREVPKKEKTENKPEVLKSANEKIRVMTVFGTRPEAIKMAPLVKELEKREEIESVVCITAQHRQMLDQVMERFSIKADYDLDIMQQKQTLSTITSKALNGLEDVIKEVKPDIVLVHGDTSTTFAGALASFYCQTKVGHVEAGLRTYDKYSPYPEEMNRKLVTQIADLFFAPTQNNKNHLLKEDVPEDVIFITGNTVIDAVKSTVKDDYVFQNETLKSLDYKNNRVVLVTAHRRENLGEPLKNICRAILEMVNTHEDVHVVYPVHLNPAVREVAFGILGEHERIHLIDPLDVEELHNLMGKCYMVMTDSGGLQEEAPSLGKPVLVLRNETERPEAVHAGTVKLAGVDEKVILKLSNELLDNEKEYEKMSHAVNPYGDGYASQRTVDAIIYYFGKSENKPQDFSY